MFSKYMNHMAENQYYTNPECTSALGVFEISVDTPRRMDSRALVSIEELLDDFSYRDGLLYKTDEGLRRGITEVNAQIKREIH